MSASAVYIDYTNHRGERRVRCILPLSPLRWGSNEWHPEPQWLLEAYDVERKDNVPRYFAVLNIHAFGLTRETCVPKSKKKERL